MKCLQSYLIKRMKFEVLVMMEKYYNLCVFNIFLLF